MWRSMDVSGGKNLTPTETVSVEVQPSSFSVPFWCSVGRMLGNLGSKLGPCWVWQFCHFAWPLLKSRNRTPPSPPIFVFPEFPKANLTLDGVRFPGRTQVENLRSVGVCGRENRTPTKNDFCEGSFLAPFWGYVGPMFGNLGSNIYLQETFRNPYTFKFSIRGRWSGIFNFHIVSF